MRPCAFCVCFFVCNMAFHQAKRLNSEMHFGLRLKPRGNENFKADENKYCPADKTCLACKLTDDDCVDCGVKLLEKAAEKHRPEKLQHLRHDIAGCQVNIF